MGWWSRCWIEDVENGGGSYKGCLLGFSSLAPLFGGWFLRGLMLRVPVQHNTDSLPQISFADILGYNFFRYSLSSKCLS